MVALIEGLSDTSSPRTLNTFARHIAVKEEHAAIAEHEIIILWTDYFRPEHAEKYPNLHDLVWKTCKLTSTVKQQINAQAAQDLLAGVQQIAEIFWETKGVKTKRVPSGQPTGGEIVQPVLGQHYSARPRSGGKQRPPPLLCCDPVWRAHSGET